MDIQIINKELQLTLFGFSSIALNNDYGGTAFKLSGKMWEVVKANGLKNKGKNVWVYLPEHKVFAGVELEGEPGDNCHGLEQMLVKLEKYAYFKHIGPYQFIKQVGQNMSSALGNEGLKTTLPYIEIYGHWPGDESKAETELFISLK
jgi:effector-binding domain-containing protein